MQDYNDNKPNGNRQGARRPVSGQGQGQGTAKRRPANGQGQAARGQQRPRPNTAPKAKRKKNAKKKKWKIALFAVEILVICTLVGVFWAMSKANKIQHVKITDEEKKEELAIDGSSSLIRARVRIRL